MKRRPVLFASAAAVSLWSAWIVMGRSGESTQGPASHGTRAPLPPGRATAPAEAVTPVVARACVL